MTKQEKIKEEWVKAIGLDIWIFINDFSYIMKNGYIDGESQSLNHIRKILYSQNNIDITIVDEIQFIRPKSLKGIEDNNGWIKIESEDDLPKEDLDCLIYFSDGEIRCDSFLFRHGNFRSVHYRHISHYQPMQKPEPPIY